MEQEKKRFQAQFTADVPKILNELGCVLAISTYQAGKLVFIGAKSDTGLYQIPVSFKKPMGIALDKNKMAVATLEEVQVFSYSESLAKSFPDNPSTFDRLYFPRATFYSGATDLHDIHFGKGGLWAVNTKFCCLQTFDMNYSFRPRWKPPFITELLPEDRCHLNGMAMVDSQPRYVTALSQTDIKGGWREHITKTGIVMTVPEGEVILDGLAMPHSPRIIDGDLYLLMSATGEVIKVDVEKRTYESKIKLGGFIRGLAYSGDYLFVGQSKVRKSSKTFSKLPVSEMADHAGIIIVDRRDWKVVGELKYDSTVEEIYDVQVLENVNKPGLFRVEDERHRRGLMIPGFSFWRSEIKNEPSDSRE